MHASHDTSILKTAWGDTKRGIEQPCEFPLAEDARVGRPCKFPLAEDAMSFFKRHGFVVITEVMSEDDNDAVKQGLVEDLHEINPATKHIKDVGDFKEEELPTSPNHSFRTTCNICFGRFASMIRGHTGVRSAFAGLHETEADRLGCSFDSIFYTPQSDEVNATLSTQLHWDHNSYSAGERWPLSEDLCVQGVYYASATDETTPCFACSPGSQSAWETFSESEHNPARHGEKLVNYLPMDTFDDDFVAQSGLPLPVRVHVPARSLVLWNSRTAHGNCPPAVAREEEGGPAPTAGGGLGRVSLAISFGPVDRRDVGTQKDALVKALGGVRTTHHPTAMLTHNLQGYPVDWTTEAEYEPNKALSNLTVGPRSTVTQADFEAMIARSALSPAEKRTVAQRTSIGNVSERTYRAYWGLTGGDEEDRKVYEQMSQLAIEDLRVLIDPRFCGVQGRHHTEIEACNAADPKS